MVGKEDQDLIDAVIGSLTAPATGAYRERGEPEVYELNSEVVNATTALDSIQTEGGQPRG